MISVGSSAAISVSVRFKLSGLIRIEYEKLIILTKKKKNGFCRQIILKFSTVWVISISVVLKQN